MIVCLGTELCERLHHGIHETQNDRGQTRYHLESILTCKEERDKLIACNFAAGRAFHPGCLHRQEARGAYVFKSYSHDSKKTKYGPMDHTHRLCDDCLGQWCDNGGEASELAKRGETYVFIFHYIIHSGLL